MFDLFSNSIQQTLVFLPLAFGVYLSYEVLEVTDLTVEGTFVMGAAIFARLYTAGMNQVLAIACAIAGGMIIGALVAGMQRVTKINSLIAGILAVFMLYSINFGIMGLPNISLLSSSVFLQNLQSYHPELLNIVLWVIIAVLFFAGLLFLHSKTGLYLRAFGSNPNLLHKLGKKPGLYLGLGLALSNGIAALCGVMTAQMNGYADIHMGQGMALTAIGAVVIGKKIVSSIFPEKNFSALIGMISCFIGGLIYFLLLNGFLIWGLNPIYIKLFIGGVLAIFLSGARRRGGGSYAAAY